MYITKSTQFIHSPVPLFSWFCAACLSAPSPLLFWLDSHTVTPPSNRTANSPAWMPDPALPHTTFHRLSMPLLSRCSVKRWCLLSWVRVICVAPTEDMLLILSAELSPLLLSEYSSVTWMHFCLSFARYRWAGLPVKQKEIHTCTCVWTAKLFRICSPHVVHNVI